MNEVLPGNTSDKTTLRAFLSISKIEAQYAKPSASGRWIAASPPKRRPIRPSPIWWEHPRDDSASWKKSLVGLPWREVRPGVEVKLLAADDDLYVFAQSRARIDKERAMRKRQLKQLWARLAKLADMDLSRESLLMKLGAARAKAPAAWRLLDITVDPHKAAFTYALNRKKLRQARRREGRYLLRTNLRGHDPAELWRFYIQLVEVEAAFKNLKDDLKLRPVYHQLEHRVEAHIFVAFLAYCLHVTLRARLRPMAPGLTPRADAAVYNTFNVQRGLSSAQSQPRNPQTIRVRSPAPP